MTEPHLEHSIFGAGRASQDGAPQTRAQRRAGSRKPRRKGRRSGCLMVALVVVTLAAFAAYTVLRPVVDGLMESNDYPGPGTGEVQVTVSEGEYPPAMGAALEKAGVVKTAKAFVSAAKAESRSTAIQPGTYTFRKEMAAVDALAVLIDPDNRSKAGRVTIREGLWRSEVFAALSKGTGVPVAEYVAAAKNPAALGLPASAKGNLEGYLFPSTYEFTPKQTATVQLKTMVAKTLQELTKAQVPEADQQRILTVASIVEGEVSGDADRSKVARVIDNRLALTGPPTYGLLQMDSTVHFAVQKRGKAGTTDADRSSPSPYNTYKRKGLPPGPINSPGAASIEAAAHPADGSWLFFVTVDPSTGETRFATTPAEHEVNVQQFQAWCRQHAGKC